MAEAADFADLLREKNRRVEFRIAEVDGKAVTPDAPAPASPSTGPTPVVPVVRP